MSNITLGISLSTRPDIIKLIPIIYELKKRNIKYFLFHTQQHTELAYQVFKLFNINPDYAASLLPKENLNLTDMFSHYLSFFKDCIDTLYSEKNIKLDGMIVHGDVIGSLAGAMSAFFHKIPIFHIEAGLRTSDFTYPFPEEGTRRLISKIASIHFAPTIHSRNNLLREGTEISEVIVSGNTIIDSLKLLDEIKSVLYVAPLIPFQSDTLKKIILTTLHRRELWESSDFEKYLLTLAMFVDSNKHIYTCLFPMHTNPILRNKIKALQEEYPILMASINFIEPLPYDQFIGILKKYAWFVVTDSGGIIEESSAFGVPVLILRKDTERPEASSVDPEYAQIIGNDQSIFEKALYNLTNNDKFAERRPNTVFGIGNSAEIIINNIVRYIGDSH